MTEKERLKYIKKVENSFTKEDRKRYLKSLNGIVTEPFNIGINGWINNVNERIEKHPESKDVLQFEKYVLYKLYNYAEKLRTESDKLFT